MSDVTEWAVPAEVQEEFRKEDAKVSGFLMQIGKLEADYSADKSRLLAAVAASNKARLDVVLEAAKAAGLDMDQKWTLDLASMKLSKQ